MSRTQIDKQLPEAEVDGKAVRLDHWWAAVFKTGGYQQCMPITMSQPVSKIRKVCAGLTAAPRKLNAITALNQLTESDNSRD